MISHTIFTQLIQLSQTVTPMLMGSPECNLLEWLGKKREFGEYSVSPFRSLHESFQTMEPASQTEYLLVPKEHYIPASHQ